MVATIYSVAADDLVRHRGPGLPTHDGAVVRGVAVCASAAQTGAPAEVRPIPSREIWHCAQRPRCADIDPFRSSSRRFGRSSRSGGLPACGTACPPVARFPNRRRTVGRSYLAVGKPPLLWLPFDSAHGLEPVETAATVRVGNLRLCRRKCRRPPRERLSSSPPLMSKRLGVGFIGSGFITRFHIQSWLAVRDCRHPRPLGPSNAAEAATLARSSGRRGPRLSLDHRNGRGPRDRRAVDLRTKTTGGSRISRNRRRAGIRPGQTRRHRVRNPWRAMLRRRSAAWS